MAWGRVKHAKPGGNVVGLLPPGNEKGGAGGYRPSRRARESAGPMATGRGQGPAVDENLHKPPLLRRIGPGSRAKRALSRDDNRLNDTNAGKGSRRALEEAAPFSSQVFIDRRKGLGAFGIQLFHLVVMKPERRGRCENRRR